MPDREKPPLLIQMDSLGSGSVQDEWKQVCKALGIVMNLPEALISDRLEQFSVCTTVIINLWGATTKHDTRAEGNLLSTCR